MQLSRCNHSIPQSELDLLIYKERRTNQIYSLLAFISHPPAAGCQWQGIALGVGRMGGHTALTPASSLGHCCSRLPASAP